MTRSTTAPNAMLSRAFPSCRCGGRPEPARIPANHDRPAMTFLRCFACGRERDHQVEVMPAGGLSALRAAKKAQMAARLDRLRSNAGLAHGCDQPVPRLRTVAPDPIKLDNLRMGLAARSSLYLADLPC